MRAITQRRYGGPENLTLADVPRPVPGKGEVLIRVEAASVNAADWLLMRGEPYIARLAFGIRRPRVTTRGRDVAGVVETVGPGASGFAVGDEVYGEVDAGSFAEYTVASVARLALKPTSLTFEQAAAVPLAATTALKGLRDCGRVKAGDRVLINGASGGVGSFAVQIARALGADVTAICSTRNREAALLWGADEVIDYTTTDFTTSGEYDVILDIAGTRSLRDIERALTPRGTLVLASGAGGRLLGPIGRILAASVRGMFSRRAFRPLVSATTTADLDVLSELIDAGSVMPAIERTYLLEETADALTHLGIEHARGKLVIAVS